MGMLEFVKGAFAALPKTVEVRRCRGDSQLYNPPTLQYLSGEGIEFAVGARVKQPLLEACEQIPEQEWKLVDDNGDTRVDVAFANYLPRDLTELPGLRYVAVRMTPRQQDLLDGSRRVRYSAIASTRPGTAVEVTRWYWGKAGTIEQVHDVVKNELGGGVPPCGRFGANAAWFRLSALTFNVFSVMKKLGPPELRNARPKRLRFRLLTIPATLVSHARSLVARLTETFCDAAGAVTLRDMLWQGPEPAPTT
jgi:hypothetical protein